MRQPDEPKYSTRTQEDAAIFELLDYWDELAGGKARLQFKTSVLRRYVRVLEEEQIKDAMEIAIDRCGDWRGVRYTIGILRKWVADEDGEAGDG